jgi:CCT motif
LEDKGIINRNEKGVLKDLIISGDEALQEALEKYEKGDKSQLETMIKSGLLSQKLPADLDLLGELDLDFLTVDDATIGSMGNQNVESHPGFQGHRAKGGVISFLSSGNSVGGGSQYNEGIDEFDFANDLGGDGDSYLRYNSRSNSIDLDSYRLRSNSIRSESMDGRDRSNSLALPDIRSRSNSLAMNELRDRSNSLAFGVLQHDAPLTEASAAAAASHQRWMDRPVAGKGDEIDLRRGPNPPVAVSGIGASLAEYNNRTNPKLTKSQIAEEKRRERLLKKDEREREKQEQKERKDQERRDKKDQKEREKSEKKTKKALKPKPKEEEPDQVEERIIESGTGRPRSMSDPNLKTNIDSNGLLEVERPDGWVGAYSPDSRKMRIERFLEKRNHRVWTKSVKYDVRKNFADSRLRVKGRFVKKEDELLMRELMSLT